MLVHKVMYVVMHIAITRMLEMVVMGGFMDSLDGHLYKAMSIAIGAGHVRTPNDCQLWPTAPMKLKKKPLKIGAPSMSICPSLEM